MEQPVEQRPTAPPEEMAMLRLKAENILSAHLRSEEAKSIFKIERRDDGFYDVGFYHIWDGRESAEIAVLDLDFPFASEDVSTILSKCSQRADREIFLSIGPGSIDLPSKRHEDKRTGLKRIFIISDPGFGIARRKENLLDHNQHGLALKGISYCIESTDVRDLPEESHLFGRLDLDAIPEDSIDTIQVSNVLSDLWTSVLRQPSSHHHRDVRCVACSCG